MFKLIFAGCRLVG